MSDDPQGIDSGDYVEDGSIQWDDLLGASAGAIVTAIVVVAWDMFNFAVTGAFSYVGAWFEGLAGVVRTPYEAGASAFEAGYQSGAEALAVAGPFAFPISVVLVAISVWLVIYGVNSLVR